jgi:hypothetical protein
VSRNIWKKSLRQKLDALKYIRKNAKTTHNALLYICAIFEQEQYNAENVEMLAESWAKKQFIDAYPIALCWIEQVQEYEKYVQGKLKPLKITDEQRQAGIENLKKWGDYSVYDRLAGGDLKSYDVVLDMHLDKITAKILYDNEVAHYQQTLQDIFIEKSKQPKK